MLSQPPLELVWTHGPGFVMILELSWGMLWAQMEVGTFSQDPSGLETNPSQPETKGAVSESPPSPANRLRVRDQGQDSSSDKGTGRFNLAWSLPAQSQPRIPVPEN